MEIYAQNTVIANQKWVELPKTLETVNKKHIECTKISWKNECGIIFNDISN